MASRPIDEKIVVMNLDNSEFKRKAAETTGIFGKLKSIFSKAGDTNLNKVTKDLNDIEKAANRVDMSSLSSSVDTIASRFSSLGVIATTALTNITNKAVNAGLAMQKSLTTDQVVDGFREYETKIGSIGTVLANTKHNGSTLEDVKKALSELNDYADDTIYNFGQMTANIGRFTAAGANLEDSTTAIKGLSNLAAISGSTSEQLNNAMYQMSQALSPGYKLNLMDWNSLQNSGMGGKITQDGLRETAKAMGKTIDMSKTFRESISDGWLTSEVLLATLKKFGEDESMSKAATEVRTLTGFISSLREGIGSGWAETWELVFGDFDQATRFWTAVSNITSGFFQKQTDARNNFIRGLIDSGAVGKFGEVVRNVGTPIVQLFKSIGSAFKTIFPPVSSNGLVTLLTNIADATKNLKMNAETVENVKTIFKGFFAGISTVIEVVKILAGALLGLIPGFSGAGGGITSLLARFSEITISINEYLKSGDLAERITEKLKTVFGGLGSVLSGIGSAFANVSSFIEQAISIMSKGSFTEGILEEDSKTVGALYALRDGFKSVFDYISAINFSAIGSGIGAFFSGIGSTIEWIKGAISSVIGFFKNLFPTIADNQGWILAGGGLAAMAAIIWKVYETFKSVVGIFDNFADTLEGVSDALGAFTLGIHVKSLLVIAMAVGILAVSLMLLSRLNGKQIATSLTAVVVSLGALVGALAIISKKEIEGNIGAIMSIVGLAVAVAILSTAVVKLGEMDINKAKQGVLALVTLLGALAGALTLMSKYGGTFAVSAAQFIALAGALAIMTYAISKLSEIKPWDIVKGVAAIGILLLELAIFVRIASSNTATLSASAAGLLATAGAILLIVHAIKQISKIETDDLKEGLLTVGFILLLVGTFTEVVKEGDLLRAGAGLLLLAAAMNALIIPIATLGVIPIDILAKGIGALTVFLAAFAATSKYMTATIPAAIAIGLLAAALNLLIIPIVALGLMSWDGIFKGVGGLALALLTLGGVAALLGLATIPLIAFSVAIVAIGVGFLALGAGISLLAKSFLILSTMTVGAVTVFVAAFGAFFTGVTALLPAVTDLIMKVINAIAEVMVKMAPKVADAIGRLLLAVLEKIKEYTPQVLTLVSDVLILILEKIAEFIPRVVITVLDLLLSLLGVIETYIPLFIEAGANIIIAIFNGLGTYIPQVIQAMADFVLDIVVGMSDTLRNNGTEFVDAVTELMGEVILIVVHAGVNMIDALFGWIPGVSEATSKIGKSAEKYISENFRADELGDEKGSEFASSVAGTESLASSAGTLIANAGVDGASSVDASGTGVNFAQGFVNGISSSEVLSNAISSARSLASAAWRTIKEELDIRSPSRLTTRLGENTGTGFVNGINATRPSLVESVLGWTSDVKKSVKSTAKVTEKESTKVGTSAVEGISKGFSNSKKKASTSVKKTAESIASDATKAFNEKMEDLDYKFEMGTINFDKYVSGIKKLKTEYSKHPKIVKEINAKLKKIEEDHRKEQFDNSKEWIDDRKYYNELSIKDELKAWERIQARYKKGTDERKQADKEVYRLKNELVKNEFENSKKWIDDKKEYNELSLKEELSAWERVQARYKAGTEERKEADREVFRVKKDINQRLIDLNEEYIGKIKDANQKLSDDIKALNADYDSDLASRISSLKSAYGLFDDIRKDDEEKKKNPISGTKLVTNLRDQVVEFTKWTNDIRTLASRGIDNGLLDELRNMGPSAADEIEALVALTDSQLTDYSNLWLTKSELARVTAIEELAWLREDIDNEIIELQNNTATQLEEYKDEWITKIQEIRTGTTDEFKGMNITMEQIGEDAIKGLTNGMSNMSEPLIAEAKSLADSVTKTIKDTLKIKSPSRVLMGLGRYAGEGLAKGIANSKQSVVNKANSVIQGLVEAFDLPQDDKEIRIRAVLDYDGFDNSKLVKMATVGIDSGVSLANNNLSAIQKVKDAPLLNTPKDPNANQDIKGLISAVVDLVNRPNVTQLTVDGRKMAEVVSGHQYNASAIGAISRGVVL